VREVCVLFWSDVKCGGGGGGGGDDDDTDLATYLR
jgi:hypothetical protein